MNEEKICKYCGEPIPKGGVWNPDEHGDGYHHKCLIDMEFDENEAYMKNLKNYAIIIPDNATNGDMIKAMFPKAIKSNYIESSIDFEDYVEIYLGDYLMRVSYDWWNAPYKTESEGV